MKIVPFAVVMAVYHADEPSYALEAVDSVLNQTAPPSELIIVVDGPVGPNLELFLGEIKHRSLVRILRLETNQGPGASRHAAILSAQHEIIAIMDADDISLPGRFERQLKQLEELDVDVVGGFIEEFDETSGDLRRVREVPLAHGDILRFGRWRSPMNHVTIMFRRNAYMSVGGYHTLRGVEDYDLFHRMFVAGFKFANIPDVLVHVRSGSSVLARRRGFSYLRQELALMRRMRSSGYLTIWQWAANNCLRIWVRFLPSSAIGLIYRLLRKRTTIPNS